MEYLTYLGIILNYHIDLNIIIDYSHCQFYRNVKDNLQFCNKHSDILNMRKSEYIECINPIKKFKQI